MLIGVALATYLEFELVALFEQHFGSTCCMFKGTRLTRETD